MYKFVKRFLDVIISLILFIVLLPLFILLTIILFIVNSGDPFFLQTRPGKNGKIFKLIKFRTMNNKKDHKGSLLSDADRMTSIGQWLRKNSLDEIPQLLNVIKGDMSLIGPRPLLVEYIPLYNNFQKRRHEVRPGITGWAQVNGRNAISWDEKFRYDVWYIDNSGFSLDMKIMFLTIIKVFKREGINAKDFLTVEKFRGNQ